VFLVGRETGNLAHPVAHLEARVVVRALGEAAHFPLDDDAVARVARTDLAVNGLVAGRRLVKELGPARARRIAVRVRVSQTERVRFTGPIHAP
jgi:hypothetical protein